MAQLSPLKKRGHLGVLLITLAAFLIISPAYVTGYLSAKGRVSITLAALLSLGMFVVGAFLIIELLEE
jgi:hypothetical protein